MASGKPNSPARASLLFSGDTTAPRAVDCGVHVAVKLSGVAPVEAGAKLTVAVAEDTEVCSVVTWDNTGALGAPPASVVTNSVSEVSLVPMPVVVTALQLYCVLAASPVTVIVLLDDVVLSLSQVSV